MLLLATAGTASGARTQDTGFRSVALDGTLHFEITLPADYDASGKRYPVLYFLHGLPSGSDAYRNVGFVQRALDAAGQPAILVVPQGARSGQPDPEYLDRGPGRNWETAIANELPRIIDSRFRTIRSRTGRALIGVSAGGYGAMHLALKHLASFSVAESWSGYFHPTDPAGLQALDLGSDHDNDDANVHRQLAKLKQLRTFVAFYVGKGDTRFAAENEQLNLELSRIGVPHVFRLYAGGHDQSLWGRYATPWLSLALTHLAPAA